MEQQDREDYSDDDIMTPALIDFSMGEPQTSVTQILAPQNELQADDLKYINQAIQSLGQAFSIAKTVAEVCKLTLAITKALETRRHLLGARYGAPPSGKTISEDYLTALN